MSFALNIPNEVIEAAKIPRDQLKKTLTREMAFMLYERGMLSLGTARRYSKLSKWEFLEELSVRGIERHYYETELKEDVAYARHHQ